jgi:hypothetical protein
MSIRFWWESQKPEGGKVLERHRCRWDDNIKMNVIEIECGDVN